MKLSSRSVIVLFIGAVLILVVGFWIRGRYYYPVANRSTATGEAIVAFGDSLTYGTGAARGQDWPSVVARKCHCDIINKGIPGETTEGALARLDKDVLNLKPRLVIVGLGGNDMLQRLPRDRMIENLKEIITQIQQSGAMVALVGLKGFPLDNGTGASYKRLARETGSIYIPNILGGIFTDSKLKSDQVHPNAAGYAIMADRIYDRIKPYL